MNFKILLILFLVCSCGVKGDPSSPADQNLPSVMDNYEDITIDQPLKDSAIKRK